MLILTFSLFYSVILCAQDDNIYDNSEYFDDGGIAASKNIVKLNVLSAANGDLAFMYERVAADAFAIEAGAGLLMPFYYREFPVNYLERTDISDPGFGYSLWLQPKFYRRYNAPEYDYTGILIRYRHYSQDNRIITYKDVVLNYGIQFLFGNRFYFNYDIGIGIRFKSGDGIPIKERGFDVSNVIIPMGLKLGICF